MEYHLTKELNICCKAFEGRVDEPKEATLFLCIARLEALERELEGIGGGGE